MPGMVEVSPAEFAAARATLRGARVGSLRRFGQQTAVKGAPEFELDPASLSGCTRYLNRLADVSDRAIVGGLNYVALQWLAEVQRHMPVDVGLARASMNVSPARVGEGKQRGVHEAKIGTNVPYVVWLEYGTDFIAGGAVKQWRYGDAPILDWPAKRGDATSDTALQRTRDKGGVRHRNARGQFVSRQSGSQAEFMPPLRGSWMLLSDRLVSELAARFVLAVQAEDRPK